MGCVTIAGSVLRFAWSCAGSQMRIAEIDVTSRQPNLEQYRIPSTPLPPPPQPTNHRGVSLGAASHVQGLPVSPMPAASRQTGVPKSCLRIAWTIADRVDVVEIPEYDEAVLALANRIQRGSYTESPISVVQRAYPKLPQLPPTAKPLQREMSALQSLVSTNLHPSAASRRRSSSFLLIRSRRRRATWIRLRPDASSSC